MSDFEAAVLADLSVLKPGRLAHLEDRILDHEKAVQRLKGMAAAFGALLTFAHIAIDVVLGRR